MRRHWPAAGARKAKMQETTEEEYVRLHRTKVGKKINKTNIMMNVCIEHWDLKTVSCYLRTT